MRGKVTFQMRLLLLIGVVLAAYGQPAWPPRKILYQGVLIDADTADPVPGAVVTTLPKLLYPRPDPSATTDGNGRFQIEMPDLPHLAEDIWRISKENYVYEPLASNYGEFLPNTGDGRVRRLLTLRTIRQATVTGVILNHRGKPAIGSTVQFIPLEGHAIEGSEPTDRSGHFHVKVRPGAYLVCAHAPTPGWNPWDGSSVASAFITTATCFPSAREYASAEVVSAPRGQTIGPLTIRLNREQTYRIRGRIDSSVPHTGTWGATIQAAAHVPVNSYPWFERYVSGCVNRDGTFSISGMTRGTYTLSVSAGSEVKSQKCGAPSIWKGMDFRTDDCCSDEPRPAPAPLYKGSRTILVNARVNDLVMTAGRDATVNGQLVFKDTRPADLQSLRLISTATIVDTSSFEGPFFDIHAESDGRFQIKDLMSGEYRLWLEPGGNYVSGVQQDGRDSADGKIRIDQGHETNLEVTLKKARSMLQINLVGQADQPAGSRLVVVVIPEGQLTATALRNRPEKCSVTNGSVLERGPFPPGEYLVFAAYCSSNSDYLWPLGAERIAGTPVRVVLGEEEKKVIEVRPSRSNIPTPK